MMLYNETQKKINKTFVELVQNIKIKFITDDMIHLIISGKVFFSSIVFCILIYPETLHFPNALLKI